MPLYAFIGSFLTVTINSGQNSLKAASKAHLIWNVSLIVLTYMALFGETVFGDTSPELVYRGVEEGCCVRRENRDKFGLKRVPWDPFQAKFGGIVPARNPLLCPAGQ